MNNIIKISKDGAPPTPPSGNSGDGILPVSPDYKFIRQQQGKANDQDTIREYHGQMWDVKNGGALRIAQLEATHSSQAADEAQAEFQRAKSKLDNTDQYEVGSETHDEDGNPVKGKTLPYSDWPKFELMKMIALLITSFILLGLGGVNVAVLILSSDIPAFLDNPHLAYLLGCIVPAIAMAVKSGETLCQLDRHKHNYAKTVYVLAGIVSFAFIVLLTITFEGNTGGDIWSDISEGASDHSHLHTLRNITQLLSEVLVGAAIFSFIDRTHTKFSSNSITEKTGWRELKEQADSLRDARDNARKISNIKAAAEKQLEAARNAFTLEAVGHLSD